MVVAIAYIVYTTLQVCDRLFLCNHPDLGNQVRCIELVELHKRLQYTESHVQCTSIADLDYLQLMTLGSVLQLQLCVSCIYQNAYSITGLYRHSTRPLKPDKKT